jgi:signal transduction histidine kinase
VTAIRQGSTLVGFAKLMRDRTDMRIATEANANLLASANQALDRTRSFLQTLGHELRNPLAPIKNSAYLLTRLSEDPRIQKIAQTIQNQVASMERLTADLMDVARLEHQGLELRLIEADVRALVQEEVGGLLLPAKAKGLELLTLVPEAPLPARIDPDRVRQAVTNLLTNAIKYTPEGGTVYAKVTLEGGDAVIRVEDTGIGIAPDMLPRLFDLFTRDTRARDLAPSGLGVGLAMVRQIAQLHGGVASARSAGEGKGSEFALRLPQAGPPNVARS